MTRAGRALACCARAALVAAALWLAGCASTPQASFERDAEAKQFVTHPNAATIYVYRGDFPAADAMDSVLYVDNRLIGATLPGTYFRIDARPGVHLLYGFGYDQGRLKIDTRSGELYFVSLNVIAGNSRFAPINPEVGKKEVMRCCELLENWAPGQRPLLR